MSTSGLVAAHAKRDAAVASPVTASCADFRYPASLANVSAIRIPKRPPSAGMSGAAMLGTWSYSLAGTRRRTPSRAAYAIATVNASDATTRIPTGSEVSQSTYGLPAVPGRVARERHVDAGNVELLIDDLQRSLHGHRLEPADAGVERIVERVEQQHHRRQDRHDGPDLQRLDDRAARHCRRRTA